MHFKLPRLIHLRSSCFLSAMLVSAIIGAPLCADSEELKEPLGKVIHSATVPSEFNGKPIRTITIQIREIFDEADLNGIYRTANDLKISTREKVVRRELLFKEGEDYDQFLIEESVRNLRTQGYLRSVLITPKPNGDGVDVEVIVQDTWTLIPQVSFSSGTGRERKSVGLSESNLLGYGKRFEMLFEKDESRETIEGVWVDPRVWGTSNELVAGYFDRSDGERSLLSFGHPFRSLVDPRSWSATSDISDTIGRLFENGDERYIFRQKQTEVGLRYTLAQGHAEQLVRRYSVGYDYIESNFSQADQKDYDDLDLDPAEVSNDPALLAEDRRFSGPVLNYQEIQPEFISMNYIDRFDRVEDYNLGEEVSVNSHFAPDFLGSRGNTYLFSANRSEGRKFSDSSFARGEFGVASRIDSDGFANTLARTELRYYNVLGSLSTQRLWLGRHTMASSFFLDYGDDLDADREFLLGADNALRGYKARTFSGDKRLALNVEDRVHLLDDVFKLVSVGAAVFIDAGGATDEAFGTIFTDHFYSDVGAGLRFAFPRSSGGKVFRIDIALPLRDGPDGSGQFEPRVIFAGGQLFGSRLRSETLGPEKASVAVGFDN